MMEAKNYLLIHGAWHGSWCWQKLADTLREESHNVLTPDLPGHGKNNLPFESINLTTYVDYLTDLLNQLDKPAILVGHSMGGIVITALAEKMPHKISRLVYVSGFIPSNGCSLVDEVMKGKESGVSAATKINDAEHAIEFTDINKAKTLFYNCCSEEDVQLALNTLQAQPLFPFIDKVYTSEKNFGSVPKTYIECLQDNAIDISDQRRMHSQTNCKVLVIDTDHSPFFSATNQLKKLIG
jgi:pimeloyl-ACP methyl ester carboxylesterase